MTTPNSTPRTLFEKVWQQHVVAEPAGEPTILYIDLQLVHEVTSPQAFDGLRMAGRKLRRPDRHIATVDHNVPTTSAQDRLVIADQISRAQVNALRKNCAEFGIEFFDVQDARQGIVHMIGPELGATKPGMTIVCGDSHTSTHGAFGALAFGIGTSEVEHVMATQTLPQSKPKTFRITVDGELPFGVTAKDIILDIIGTIGTDGATGYVIEYAGSAIRALSMEGRMTICNMSIEAGARAGMIAPDETTFAYLKGRRFSPQGRSMGRGRRALAHAAHAIPARSFDRELHHRRRHSRARRHLGHLARHGHHRRRHRAHLDDARNRSRPQDLRARLEYMDLKPGTQSKTSDRSPSSSAPAPTAASKICAPPRSRQRPPRRHHVRAMVVPGSSRSSARPKKKASITIFKTAGFEWREPGCSMCLGMNPDILQPGERCASTSNRNFEGRQGRGGRTHLVSPEMAAAAAITGHFTDIRNWSGKYSEACTR